MQANVSSERGWLTCYTLIGNRATRLLDGDTNKLGKRGQCNYTTALLLQRMNKC